MAEAKLRIKLKHDTEANWLKATTFVPLKGELIIYDVDSTHSVPRFKVGDGTTLINNLPFLIAPADNAATAFYPYLHKIHAYKSGTYNPLGSHYVDLTIASLDNSRANTPDQIKALLGETFKYFPDGQVEDNEELYKVEYITQDGLFYTVGSTLKVSPWSSLTVVDDAVQDYSKVWDNIGDVKLAGNNTFTGTNTFKDNQVKIMKTPPQGAGTHENYYRNILLNNESIFVSGGEQLGSSTQIKAEKVEIDSYNSYCSLEMGGVIKNGDSQSEAFSLTLPKKNGTLATTDDNGDTTYRGTTITGTSTTPTVFSNSGITAAKVGDWYINTNDGSVYQCTVAGNAATAKWVYKCTQAVLEGATYMGVGSLTDQLGAFLSMSDGSGVLKLINPANVASTIEPAFGLNEGHYFLPDIVNEFNTIALANVISKTITAWPSGTGAVSVSFTTEENNSIINYNCFQSVVLKIGTSDSNFRYFYPVSNDNNSMYTFVTIDREYKIVVTGGIGQLTSVKPAELTGNNTFTGTNTFNSTLTCPGGVMSPIIYPGGENALTVPKKDGTLATIEDLTAQFGALNIQNGSGVKSIQQGADPKYNGVIKAASKNPYAKVLYPELTDAEPLGAIGDYAASFGGNSSVQAKRGIGGGTSSVTKGAYSQSLGDNTVTTPKASDSTAIGYQTTTDAPGAFTHGSFTVVMSQKYIEGMFDPSTKPGQGGSGQPTEPGTTPTDTLEMDSRRGEAASAGGFNSYSSGFAAEVDGVSNVADGHISKSSGRSNRSWSYLSKTDGKNSVVKPDPTNTDATGEGSWANGDNIQIIGAKYAYSGGNNNIVFAGADNSFSYGEGLQVKHKNQVVIGQYNDSSDSTNNDLVVVGAGTGNSNRKNAIRVTEDGKLYYGDFEVSNLKTTNDAIVSLDNKLTPKITGNTTEITKLWSTLRDTNTNLNRLNETKQATLVSGTNIKTINGNSLLGSGDLVIESGGGDVTAAGDNTFTGSNVFKKAVTLYTDAVNGNSMSATLDSYKLKLLNDLGGVYADLNITDDTAPYLELKTAGHGKVKYTPESIIFTDTYGSSKTTTLKFPGQGATADSIQTLATNEDLDKKQPLLVSGTNVKTINGQSILGSGNLEISGGGGDPLFLHTLQFTGPNVFYGFTTIISKRAEQITTKTEIEAILGSSFFYPCSWYLEDTSTFGFYMTENVFQSTHETTVRDWQGVDIYDQVTEII